MSARTVAERLTADGALASRIEACLAGRTDEECEAVLARVDSYLEGFRSGGGDVDGPAILRAVRAATDTIQEPGDAYEPPEHEVAASGDPAKEDAHAPPGLRIYGFDELLALEFPPDRFLIEPYVPLGGLAAISGLGSSWKTWLMNYIGFTVAAKVEGSEHDLFCRFRTQPGRVLILALEGGLEEHHRRIAAIAASDAFRSPKGIPLYTYSGPFRAEKRENLDALGKAISELRPDLVLVDNVRLMFGGVEDDSEFGRDFQLVFQEMQAAHPSTWVVLAHPGKNGKGIRGTSAQSYALDSHLAIERKGDVGHVRHEKQRRGKEGESFAFRFVGPEEPGGAGFLYLGEHSPEAIDLEQALVTVLADEGGRLSRSALIEHFGEEQSSRLDRAIARLERDGKLRKDPAGREVVIALTKKGKARRDAA